MQHVAGKPSETLIRPATAGDVALIHQLLSELEKSLGVAQPVTRKPEDLLRYGFGENSFFDALIAWNRERPVGLAVYFSEFSTWRGSPGVYVQDLYVAADARGSGLGRQLMEAVIDRARVWGAAYCKLAVYGKNENALGFYRRLGFRVSDNERVLILDRL